MKKKGIFFILFCSFLSYGSLVSAEENFVSSSSNSDIESISSCSYKNTVSKTISFYGYDGSDTNVNAESILTSDNKNNTNQNNNEENSIVTESFSEGYSVGIKDISDDENSSFFDLYNFSINSELSFEDLASSFTESSFQLKKLAEDLGLSSSLELPDVDFETLKQEMIENMDFNSSLVLQDMIGKDAFITIYDSIELPNATDMEELYASYLAGLIVDKKEGIKLKLPSFDDSIDGPEDLFESSFGWLGDGISEQYSIGSYKSKIESDFNSSANEAYENASRGLDLSDELKKAQNGENPYSRKTFSEPDSNDSFDSTKEEILRELDF